MIIGKPQSDPTLEWFLSHCHIHKYPAKSTLIHAGEKAETLYYIVKGTVADLTRLRSVPPGDAPKAPAKSPRSPTRSSAS